nr:uncharacterized protein LOC116283707 [Vicugna pacos]
MLHPRPAALPARRTCRRFLPLRPLSSVRESGRAGEEEVAPQLRQQQVGRSAAGLLRRPNCSLASYPCPSPTLPFFCARWRLCPACISSGLRGASVRAKRWQPGGLRLSPGASSSPLPSHPEPPRSPNLPQNQRCAEELRI